MPWLLGNHTCRNISTYQPNTSNKMSPTSFAPGGGVILQTLGDGKGGQDQATSTIFAWNKSTKISKNHKQKSTTKTQPPDSSFLYCSYLQPSFSSLHAVFQILSLSHETARCACTEKALDATSRSVHSAKAFKMKAQWLQRWNTVRMNLDVGSTALAFD